MTSRDLLKMAGQNLWRTKLRTGLTLVGVTIGIAALIAMVSFGVGLEKNITEKLKSNDLFTSLTISSKAFDFKRNPHKKTATSKNASDVAINDSLVSALQRMPTVALAYPKINIPVKTILGKDSSSSITGCVPMEMKDKTPYNELFAGRYFNSDSAKEVLVSLDFLKSMNLLARKSDQLSLPVDSGFISINVDSILGQELKLITTSLKTTNPMAALAGISNILNNEITTVKIVGILKNEQFSGPSLREEIILPLLTAKALPYIGFDRISDLMDQQSKGHQYSAIYVKAKSMTDLATLKETLTNNHINYFSIDDGLAEMKKSFLILDSILGIVGLISLMVAGFGIVNTMLMSIMERKREIGIMKAIGGKNSDIRTIFFYEAGFIGLVGALLGISLGYGLSRIANLIANKHLSEQGDAYVDMFSFPAWLLLGALMFSIIISLAAGLYPAIRASKINPIDALRQEG